MNPDMATECDDCGHPIQFGVRAYAVPNGYDDKDRLIVVIVCTTCQKQRAAARYSAGL